MTTETILSKTQDLSLKYSVSEGKENIFNFHNAEETENINIANSTNIGIDLVLADESFILENKVVNENIFEGKGKSDSKSNISDLETEDILISDTNEKVLNNAEISSFTYDNSLSTKFNSSETLSSSHIPEIESQNIINSMKSMNEIKSASIEAEERDLKDFSKDVSENSLKTSEIIPQSDGSGTEMLKNSVCKEPPKAVAIILRKPVMYMFIYIFVN